ncbi:MAG: transcription antitermination factor NusB [Patescibacteria group bacterium]
MSSRHLSRTIALQTLYEWDFSHSKKESSRDELKEIIKRNSKEFGMIDEDNKFGEELTFGVIDNLEKIDDHIKKYAPQWPLEQITLIDRNILRIGVYELAVSNNTPPKVAINEAIEVAKAFSGINAGKFVNGVLGAIYEKIKDKENAKNQHEQPKS